MNANIDPWSDSFTVEPVLTGEYFFLAPALRATEIGPTLELPAFPRDAASTAFGQMIRHIDSFQRVKEGWDGYHAPRPSESAIHKAKEIVRTAFEHLLSPSAAMPSAEGGVGIIFRTGRKYADIECFNSGEVLALTSMGHGIPNVWELDGSNLALVEAIEVIREHLGQRLSTGTPAQRAVGGSNIRTVGGSLSASGADWLAGG